MEVSIKYGCGGLIRASGARIYMVAVQEEGAESVGSQKGHGEQREGEKGHGVHHRLGKDVSDEVILNVYKFLHVGS